MIQVDTGESESRLSPPATRGHFLAALWRPRVMGGGVRWSSPEGPSDQA